MNTDLEIRFDAMAEDAAIAITDLIFDLSLDEVEELDLQTA